MSSALLSNNTVRELEYSALRVAGGVLATRGSSWLSRKITDLTGANLDGALDRITPIFLKNASEKIGLKLGIPVIWVQTKLIEKGYTNLAFSKLFANVIGPAIEESVFRFGAQNGITLALTAMGLNPTAAASIATLSTSIWFGQSHNPDLQSEQFTETMLSGIVFGVLQQKGNIVEAMLAHAIYDSTI